MNHFNYEPFGHGWFICSFMGTWPISLDIQHDDFTESTLCQELLRQAQILSSFNDNRIKNQSNKTYWVGGENNELSECKENLIMLESFALAIFERHVKTFGLELTPESGAEWWVQVKHSEAVDTLFDANDNIVPQHKPIDLHYDKYKSY